MDRFGSTRQLINSLTLTASTYFINSYIGQPEKIDLLRLFAMHMQFIISQNGSLLLL